MKRVYLDTNILLTPLRHSDPNYPLVERLLEQKHLLLVTGTIALVEMYCVLSREEKLLRETLMSLDKESYIPEIITLPLQKQVSLIVNYLIYYFNLRILQDLPPENMVFSNKSIKINPIYKLAIFQSSDIKLRTLDNLHFATTQYYLKLSNLKIDYLITTDQKFISKRAKCHEFSEILVLDLKTFVDFECQSAGK